MTIRITLINQLDLNYLVDTVDERIRSTNHPTIIDQVMLARRQLQEQNNSYADTTWPRTIEITETEGVLKVEDYITEVCEAGEIECLKIHPETKVPEKRTYRVFWSHTIDYMRDIEAVDAKEAEQIARSQWAEMVDWQQIPEDWHDFNCESHFTSADRV